MFKKEVIKLSRKKFKKLICKQQCIIGCVNKPVFCYSKLYKHNSIDFEIKALTSFKNNSSLLSALLRNQSVGDTKLIHKTFKRIVCDLGFCGGCTASSKDISNCIRLFRTQFGHIRKDITTVINKKYSPPPVVYVMMSDNIEFKQEVDKILENFNKQQNQAGGPFTIS